MIIELDELQFNLEVVSDFLLLSNLHDSGIEKIKLSSGKFKKKDMIFIYEFYEKKYEILLKNNSVIYYEPEVYETIRLFFLKYMDHLQACNDLLGLCLYLGYTKLIGVLLIFKHFLTQKKDLLF